MRFAYIDSNGNEVPIPSVDALALRIELGAIKEDTELYDAHADQWGPAHTHEIFHTLSRAAEGGDGFVAPPPPVAPPSATTETKPAGKATSAASKGKASRAADPPDRDGKTDPPAAPTPEPAAVDEPEDTSFGLDLAPPQPPPSGRAPGEDALDAAPGASFDFGDVTGGFELESEFQEPDAAAAPMDFGSGSAVPDEDGPMMDFGGGLDLEEPMSEFSPDSPPGWMEAGPEHDEGDVMDFSSVAADADAGDDTLETARRPQRSTRTKPSPPKFRRRRSLVAPLMGILVLLALGVGGYVAWPIVSARLAEEEAPPQQGVFLPPIPEELVPRMREAAGLAFAGAFREARSTAGGTAPDPTRDWLAGVYLADASQYPEVETFWLQVGDVLEHVRAIDLATFHDHYARSLATVGVPADVREALAARADSGFVAATAERAEVYRLVDDLVTAALGLHEFLVANEDAIEHAPASSVTSDPVLEARPTTPVVREALDERIDRVTDALDALDYLNLVTADGLWSVVLDRIQDVGIR